MFDRNDRVPRTSHSRRVLISQHLKVLGPGRVVLHDGDHWLTVRVAVMTMATMEGNERGRSGQVPAPRRTDSNDDSDSSRQRLAPMSGGAAQRM